jgi:hypothetical protein
VYCGLRDDIVVMNCRVRKGDHCDMEKKTVASEIKLLLRKAECRVWALRCGAEVVSGLRNETVAATSRQQRCWHSDVGRK